MHALLGTFQAGPVFRDWGEGAGMSDEISSALQVLRAIKSPNIIELYEVLIQVRPAGPFSARRLNTGRY